MKQYQWHQSVGAANDIEEAVNYYNKKLHGLGNKFLADVALAINKICRNPFSFSIKYDEVRCAALKKFPFAIHFTVNEKTTMVTIVAVFNTWKEPFW